MTWGHVKIADPHIHQTKKFKLQYRLKWLYDFVVYSWKFRNEVHAAWKNYCVVQQSEWRYHFSHFTIPRAAYADFIPRHHLSPRKESSGKALVLAVAIDLNQMEVICRFPYGCIADEEDYAVQIISCELVGYTSFDEVNPVNSAHATYLPEKKFINISKNDKFSLWKRKKVPCRIFESSFTHQRYILRKTANQMIWMRVDYYKVQNKYLTTCVRHNTSSCLSCFYIQDEKFCRMLLTDPSA